MTHADEQPASELSASEVFCWSRAGRAWSWEHWGVVLAFGLALSALVLGLGLETVGWAGLAGERARGLEAAGALALAATLPLVLAGAHCLDRLEARILDAIVDGTAGVGGRHDLSPRPLAAPRYALMCERQAPPRR